MKKLLFLLLTFSCSYSFAQYATGAPWMQNATEAKPANATPTFSEVVNAFETYWENKNHKVKGSGYKPFKRWEHHWQNYLKPDGTLLTAEEIWGFWQQKQTLKNNNQNEDLSNWQTVGPSTHTNTGSWSSGQGRVNAIEVDPNNANTYYVGAPAGGIWKSVDAGSTWEPLTDELPQIGISAIAVDPSNSNIIYIGTGDEDSGDTYSIGILKSIDGGQTWSTTGLNFTNIYSSVSEIYVHPTNSNIVFAVTNNGFYKSTNGGGTFSLKFSGSFRDLKLKPTDPSVLYIVNSGNFYKSTDSGETFSMVSSGLPSSGGRQVIAVTEAAPNNVYLLRADGNYGFQGVYKSTNSGNSFVRVDNGADIFQSSQAWYDLAFAVSQTDENIMYVGVLDVYKSTNGGTSFSQWNSWSSPFGSTYTHADIHMIRFFGDDLFFGTDGGIYKSDNGSTTVDLTAGLAIGQFYKVAVSKQSSEKMVGGLQDNGGYAYSDSSWKNFYGADGMDTAIDPDDPNKYFGFIQNGGGLYFSTDGGASLSGSIDGPESGNWVTPLVMNSEGELYAGYSKLFKLVGNQFSQVSQPFSSNIDHISIDPTDNNIIYIAINHILFKSTNRGVNFSFLGSFGNDISSIAINSSNHDIVYLTTSGYSGEVLKSTDGGENFSNISYNLPSEPKLVIKHQPEHPDNPLFLGTILGVYRLDDTANVWDVFSSNLPNVPVNDLEINLVDNNITAATYGRGIWQTNIPIQMASNDVKILGVTTVESEIACGSFTPQIEVANNGLNPITTFTVDYTLDDGTPQTYTWQGSLPVEQTVNIVLPQISGSRGWHELTVVVNMPNDAFMSNNNEQSSFYLNDAGVPEEVNTFEEASDELIVMDANPTAPLWERGVPTGMVLNDATSGSNVYATNLDGQYTNSTTSYLVSQCYDLTTMSNPIVRFEMGFDLEEDWDFMYMEYSTNGGNDWEILGSANDPNWYNSNTLPGDNCTFCPGAQWTGTVPTMTTYSLNLSNFLSFNNFMVRFVFVSDQLVTQDGVVIDDFVIKESSLNVAENELEKSISVFPNPSEGIFQIKTGAGLEDLSISISDITGKIIFTEEEVANEYQLNLSAFSTGVYFLKIETAEASIVKKLIKH